MGLCLVGRSSAVRNTFIIFIVSGFWHGANWTFIAWGALNAIYFLPLLLSNRNRRNLDNVANGSLWPSFGEVRQIIVTFLLTLLAWVFFRSPDISNSFDSSLQWLLASRIFVLIKCADDNYHGRFRMDSAGKNTSYANRKT